MSDGSVRRREGGRSARVRRATLDAAMGLLFELGPDEFTVSRVAERAGVNESSIYRRWGTREGLLFGALSDYAEEYPVPDTGSLRGDLIAFAEALAGFFSTPPGAALSRALAAAKESAELGRQRTYHAQLRMDQLFEMVERGVSRGEIGPSVDRRLLLDMVIGPLHMRTVLTREPIDDDLPTRLVDAVLTGLAGADPQHPEALTAGR
ncbi:hypothetical protein CcI49_11530 [Frankia sp. CcI49]|nr:hypothetical protein CcI49_11530 [Frankia sp. CcI49]